MGSQIDGYYRYEPFGDNREKLDEAAMKIQSTFRGHKARQDAQKRQVTPQKRQTVETQDVADSFGGKGYGEKEEAAAVRIQAGYRGYNTRKELKTRGEAAVRIQAGFRGYTARKGLKEGREKPDLEIIEEEDEEDPKLMEDSKAVEKSEEEEAAAIKIQSAFRGHRTREAVQNKKKSKDPDREVSDAVQNNIKGKIQDQEAADATGEDAGAPGNKIQRDLAATKIQSSYRGYNTRKKLQGKKEAATKIQAYYRGHRVRDLRRTQSDAAIKIQSYYRGYKTREKLKKRHSTKHFLEVSNDDEFSLHRDSRTSFSLPEGVKFEGTLDDDDSDKEIDKMVDQLQAKQGLKAIEEASSPDMSTDEKGES